MDFTKELLAFEPALFSGSAEVIRVLTNLILWNGKPVLIRSDNGSELTSIAFMSWIHGERISHFLIQPWKLQRNGMEESLNRKIRDEFPNENWFHSVADASFQASNFQRFYN